MPTFDFDRALRPAYDFDDLQQAINSIENVFKSVISAHLKHDRFEEICAVYRAMENLKEAIANEAQDLAIAMELAEEEARHALAQEIEDNYQMALDNYIDRLIA